MKYIPAILALLLIGCVGAATTDGDSSAPVDEEEATQPATVIEAEEGEGTNQPLEVEDDIIIEAADGLEIVATFYVGSGTTPRPGVILLHMLGGNRQAWRGYAAQLATQGYSSLAIDMRGHGATRGSNDWEKADDDIQRAYAYLGNRPDVDESRIAIIGGSIGANMALITAAAEPMINTAILLSPGLDYRGVTTDDVIGPYGERPILIVASEGDVFAADSSRTLSELAVGNAVLQIYDGSSHGTNMLDDVPQLSDLIVDWLDNNL